MVRANWWEVYGTGARFGNRPRLLRGYLSDYQDSLTTLPSANLTRSWTELSTETGKVKSLKLIQICSLIASGSHKIEIAHNFLAVDLRLYEGPR